MRRAVEDVKRVLKIREEKEPLQQMVQQGIIGEDLLSNLLIVEKELDIEIQEVILYF